MNSSLQRVKKKVDAIREYLQLASEQIGLISRDDRTEEVDIFLNKAADGIYEAQDALEKIDTDMFYNGHVGEQIRIMRHRKKK